jgi:hypothetical protein
MYAYFPMLISGLRAPIRFDSRELDSTTPLVLFQEGPTENRVELLITIFGHGSGNPVMSAGGKLATANRVENINRNTAEFNSILASVLETTTGQELGNDASDWWNWWLDENEYYSPPEKPTEYTQIIRRVDCFVAGTPVWTTSGPMQIEKIKTGELVLAQNPETGELSYKPVLDNLARPPGALIELRLGDQLIRCAKGHPFWVSVKGWQMAKELKAISTIIS